MMAEGTVTASLDTEPAVLLPGWHDSPTTGLFWVFRSSMALPGVKAAALPREGDQPG